MTEQHAKMLLDSFKHWTGKHLLKFNDSKELLEQVQHANLIILSHGTESDPILNFGNQRALELWEMTIEQFVSTPSRLTAEAMERDERASFLKEVTANGYVSNYTGIRISRSGRKFYIREAVVWNLINDRGEYCGQAAAFNHYDYIEDDDQ